MSRTRAAAALPSVIGGPGRDFITIGKDGRCRSHMAPGSLGLGLGRGALPQPGAERGQERFEDALAFPSLEDDHAKFASGELGLVG
jgi:hypothetical protein